MTSPPPDETGRRWLKLGAVVLAIAVLLFVAIRLVGGGGHERPRHGGGDGGTPPASVAQHPSQPGGHTPPVHR